MNFVVLAITLVSFLSGGSGALDIQTLTDVPDAISVALPSSQSSAELSYRIDGTWSKWEAFFLENEQDPLLRESNLVILPKNAEEVRVRGTDDIAVHPITVSDAPVAYRVAATTNTTAPRILSRADWGADDSLLYTDKEPKPTTGEPTAGDNGGATSQRIDDCETAQLNYPEEFKTTRRTTTNEEGKRYRWAREYSKEVKLIAIHHTAIKVDGDDRSGTERVRALYTYHANNRGWGDVGYHYLIDEDGKIYEGKSGGEYVVGGHAYCNNAGSVGVALLGNFEVEQPTQKQMKSLQWLLTDLAETYDIELNGSIQWRGKTIKPVVGHGDLVSTECPGYYLEGALSQILKNAASGNVDASVRLPKKPTSKTSGNAQSRAAVRRATASSTGVPRAVRRLLQTEASQKLRRKLGSNPGREVEEGVAARRAARLNGTSVSASSKSRSSRSSSSSARSSHATSSRASEQTSQTIRIRLTRQETGAVSCDSYNMTHIRSLYRGTVDCVMVDNIAALINTVSIEDYMKGLAEEPDTEPYEKQRAFAIAARTYAVYYTNPSYRKFPGKPYDGSDSPATFQMYGGKVFEDRNPRWVEAVESTSGRVLQKDGQTIRAPYFSADDGRTRTPEEAGWKNFPFAEVFSSKDDPWCVGEQLRGHGVGMSGCGAEGQANDGKTGEEILRYYYPGTDITRVN